MPLIVATEMISRDPTCSEENIQKIIREAQEAVGDQAIIHRGGKDMSSELVLRHKEMKKAIRGKDTLLP